MLQRLIIALACGLCLAWNSAQALGLGEIVLGSGLNQRFSAEIPFTSLTPEEAVNVRARLAENADFERAGLERSAYLSSLKVNVITDGSNPRLTLSSDEIAREPLLTLLIEVKTVGSGPRVLREYTVFLDPPGIGAAAPAPLARPMALPGGSAAAANDEFFEAASDAKPGAAPAIRAPAGANASSYGPVRAGETLTSIASTLRPTGITLDQTVLALFEANRAAFSNGDINSLRRDVMLSVPSAGQMQATSADTAHTRVEELRQSPLVQNTTARATAPLIVAALPVAPSRSSSQTQSSAAIAEEEADEEETLVEESEIDAEVAPGDQAAADTTSEAGPAPASTPETDAGADAGASDSAAAVPVETAPAPASDSNLLWILIAILLLGGVMFLIVRAVRERRAQQEYDQASAVVSELPLPRTGAMGTIAKSGMSTRDELEALDRQFSDEERMTASEGQSESASAPGFGRIDPMLPDDLGKTPEISTQDPLAEAEFHLAYGLHDEAEAQLLRALQREPQRSDLRMKLAETYFATGKTTEFVDTALLLKERVSAEDWSKLAVMGRQLAPASGLFVQESAVTETLSHSPREVALTPSEKLDQGLDFRLEELELPAETVDSTIRKPDSNVLEFDLGEFDLGAPEPSYKPAPAQVFNPQDFDLDTIRAPDGGDLPDLRLEEIEPMMLDAEPVEDMIGGDDAGTKLDLARAYLEMGDMEMARSLLDEVSAQGSDAQKHDAAVLRERLSA